MAVSKIITSSLTDDTVTGAKVENNPSFDGTSHIGIPSGTTAQRPETATSGNTRFNSTIGSLEFYDGANWVSTNIIPTINSITGNILSTVSTTLTLSVNNTTDTIDVKYYESGSLIATDSGVTVTNGSATSTVPSAVYGQTAGDTISIQVFNLDGTPSSNSIDKTVTALPSGGTKTGPTGGYYYHQFNASDATGFTNTIANLSVDYLVVGGGGAGGGSNSAGGGGAGGYRASTSTLSVTNYPVTIGAGGTSTSGTYGTAQEGDDSTWNSITAIGGGRGGNYQNTGTNGGSGGGGGNSSTQKGSGTVGQGNDGGAGAGSAGNNAGGGGGGGSTSAGANGSTSGGGNGGSSTTWHNGTAYAGGGGGGRWDGGAGNAGGGGSTAGSSNTNASNATANTGGGGGGSGAQGGNGGSGVVIIRYQL